MSLRSRLLLAAAARVALALVAVDIATYSQLRANLYGQVDTRLEEFRSEIESRTSQSVTLVGGFIQLRAPDDAIVYSAPNTPDGPSLPAHITGFTESATSHESVVWFNASSATPGGPTYRVRASVPERRQPAGHRPAARPGGQDAPQPGPGGPGVHHPGPDRRGVARLVAGPAEPAPAGGHGDGRRRPSAKVSWPAGCRARPKPPRWAAWPGPST